MKFKGIPIPVLVLNIAVPVLGIIFLGWGALEIIYMYWFETVIIGLFNVPRILLASGEKVFVFGQDMTGKIREQEEANKLPKVKAFLALFFLMHYGIFLGVQGGFIFGPISEGVWDSQPYEYDISGFFGFLWVPYYALEDKHLWLSVLMLCISQLFDFVFNFIVNKDYKVQHPIMLMIAPYKRVFIQQFVVILGGFIMILTNASAGVAILLIVLKNWVDVWIASGKFKMKMPEEDEDN